TSNKWGPLIDNRTAWFIMEATVIVVFWYFVSPVIRHATTPVLIMIGLFTLHYVNRAIVFPFRIRTKNKKMPLVIMLSAVVFNLVNGSSLGYYFAHFSSYTNSWLTDVRFILGMILFFFGMSINWSSDNFLIHLRRGNDTSYIIPRGKLFNYLSCPNHFG